MPRKEVNTQQDEDNRISDFHGLNNVTDPIKLDLSWAVQADNVDVDKHGNMRRCDGYTQFNTATNCTGAYTTKDLQRYYLVDNGSLLPYDNIPVCAECEFKLEAYEQHLANIRA